MLHGAVLVLVWILVWNWNVVHAVPNALAVVVKHAVNKKKAANFI